MLVELCGREGLLVPLDRSDERFRHHRLVAEMLSTELRRLEPERAAALHRRAGEWYRAAGDDDRAVRHAVSAGDVEVAAELVWSSTVPAVSHGDKHRVEGWLDLFSDGDRVATPALALAAASTQFASGQGHLVEHWAQAAAAAPGRSPAVATSARIMHAALAREGLARMRADALDAYALTPDGSPSRAMCCLLAGTAAQLAGDAPDAVRQLEERRPSRGSDRPRRARALPDPARAAGARAGRLGGGRRAPHACPRAGGPLRPRPLSRRRARPRGVGVGPRAPRPGRGGAARPPPMRTTLRAQLTDFAAWYEVELSVVMARAAIRLSDVNAPATCSRRARRGIGGCRVR